MNLAKYLGAQKEASEIEGPQFYWCLRDFYLDISENYESADSYMEESLKPILGVSPEELKKNQIRKGILSFFKTRSCFTLCRPVDDEEQLANIEQLDWSQVKEDFRFESETFLQTVK